MAKVKILSDSGCDLDPSMIQQLNIELIPLWVTFGEQSYKDGEDITKDEFYQLLTSSPHHPKTSQPSPEQFYSAFEKYANMDMDVLCFTISSKLSGTHSTALMTVELLEAENIHVIDTQSVTLGSGLLVREAALLAQNGASLDLILDTINDLIPRTQTILMLDTLTYLQRGGRIGKVKSVLGSLMGYKPFIGVRDGLVVFLGKVRGHDSALQELQRLVTTIIETHPPQTKGVVGYTTAKSAAEQLYSLFQGSPIDAFIGQVGAVIGAHIGPNAYGLAWFGEFNPKWLNI